MFQILKTSETKTKLHFRYTEIGDIFCLLQRHHIPPTWTVTGYNLRPTLTCTHTLGIVKTKYPVSKHFTRAADTRGGSHPPRWLPVMLAFWLSLANSHPPHVITGQLSNMGCIFKSAASLWVKEIASTYLQLLSLGHFGFKFSIPNHVFKFRLYNPELQLESVKLFPKALCINKYTVK